MHIEDDPITTSEFLALYNKNLDLVKDDAQKEIDNYLELFINYKLKLKEAERLRLDKDPKYLNEFSSYKDQLTKNYISDNKVTGQLVQEAYERMRYDIKASHILILNNPEVEDTLVAYNQLLDYRKTLLNEGFSVAKEKYHNNSTILVEDLGYFSAFKMVYDFETMAYNTKPGQVSMPFKTNFGYHIVKVDDKRLSRGTVTAAHIMVALKQEDSLVDPEERINSIYKKLQQGESFEALAKQFSDDKSSARNGGKLRPFKSGQLSSMLFEDAAFSLENPGDFTAPTKTKYGWHIIQLIEKQPLQSFEAIKPMLEAQVKRDARSKLINSKMVAQLEKQYNIKKNPESKDYFKNKVLSEAFFQGKLETPEGYDGNNMVISVNEKQYTNNDFLQFLKSKQRKYMRQNTTLKDVVDTEYQLFYEQSVLDFRKQNLVNENQEFANILQEYRDGLLLFELMEKEIWNKASKDSIGLAEFFKTNTSKYIWKNRVDVVMASTSKAATAKQVQALLRQGKSSEEIKNSLNSETNEAVIFTSGIFEVSNPKLPKDLKVKEGVSEVYTHNEAFHVIDVKRILPSTPKTLNEAKGQVISDYQIHLETQWMKDLRSRYTVKVNTDELDALKAKTQIED